MGGEQAWARRHAPHPAVAAQDVHARGVNLHRHYALAVQRKLRGGASGDGVSAPARMESRTQRPARPAPQQHLHHVAAHARKGVARHAVRAQRLHCPPRVVGCQHLGGGRVPTLPVDAHAVVIPAAAAAAA